MFSVAAEWPTLVLDGKLKVRIIDQDRMTTGAGLFIQDKESNGVTIDWDFDSFRILLKGESTGTFFADDDTYNAELQFLQNTTGLGLVHFAGSKDTFGLPLHRKPYSYAFTKIENKILNLDAELGYRNRAWAGLARISHDFALGNFRIKPSIQYRKYENYFAENIAGQIDHQYISYDQYDKPFTNAINIFVKDDDVEVYSAEINFGYKINERHQLSFYNEYAKLDFKSIPTEDYFFYRSEYSYSPFAERNDSLVLFWSNKVLTQSYQKPPYNISKFDSEPLFREYDFFGVEGRFRF